MRTLGCLTALLSVASAFASAEVRKVTADFDSLKADVSPAGWESGFLGEKGAPRWLVKRERSALSASHVLRQEGDAPYAWIVRSGFEALNGVAEVQFRIESGKIDPEAGLIWRFQDARNYYYVRGNALLNNIVFYRMLDGRKEAVKSVDLPVAYGRWHRFKVVFRDDSVAVTYDGKQIMSLQDTRLRKPGRVGLFSMADTVASFDDFAAEAK
ncbi:MAG TPA: hypothetical protein VM598_06890 [Bdellovibrionota bacterium]|nr:hypothetical protein [Bdellovibrionota bacterium]